MVKHISNYVNKLKTKNSRYSGKNSGSSYRGGSVSRLSQARSFIQKRRMTLKPSRAFQSDPYGCLSQYRRGHRVVLNKLLYLLQRYNVVYPSRQYLAQQTGYSVRHIQRILDKLQSDGLVGRVWRGVKCTCVYYSSPFFDLPWVQHELRTLLRCWLTISLGMLFSVSHIFSYVTQVYHNGLFNSDSTASKFQRVTSCPMNLCNTVTAGQCTSGPMSLYGEAQHTAGDALSLSQKRKEYMEDKARKVAIEEMNPLVKYMVKHGWQDLQNGLPLTIAGCITLNAVPLSVLREAFTQYQKQKQTLSKPFNWLMKVCTQLCRKYGYTISWKQAFEQLDALGISNDASPVDEHRLASMQASQGIQGCGVYHKMDGFERNTEAQQAAMYTHEDTATSIYTVNNEYEQRELAKQKSNARIQKGHRYRTKTEQEINQAFQELDKLQSTSPQLYASRVAAMPTDIRERWQQRQQGDEERQNAQQENESGDERKEET